MFLAVSTQPVVASRPSSSQETADALSIQLHRSPGRRPPGSCPLQRDARWIADLVLEKLTPLASFHRDQAAIEALYQKLSTSEPSLEVSVEELSDYYALFKKPNTCFADIARTKRRTSKPTTPCVVPSNGSFEQPSAMPDISA
ncbi:hypothetical protein [Pseudomonas azotoformans]